MSQATFAGIQSAGDASSDYASLRFLVTQVLADVSSATLVRVTSVTNSGGVSPVGSVDVQPLVNQIDGAGNATPHGIVHGLPYFRIQGGANAVILDPQVGDLGMAVFADRDISSVKANKAQANPGSRRRFDFSDGCYFGGFLNGTPTQFVQFDANGITITSPTQVTITAPAVQINGTVTVTEDVVASSISLVKHVHGGVQTGGGNTGVPVG